MSLRKPELGRLGVGFTFRWPSESRWGLTAKSYRYRIPKIEENCILNRTLGDLDYSFEAEFFSAWKHQ